MTSNQDNNRFEKDLLHQAAQEGNFEDVVKLLKEGSNPNLFDDLGMTPLMYSAKREHIEIIKVLLELGASINIRCVEKNGNTVLGEVAGSCSYEVAKILIEAGANPTIPGWMQLTALDRAEKRKRGDGPRVYELLKSAKKSS